MNEEAAGGHWVRADYFPQCTPRLDAMNGGRQIALGGDGELRGEDGGLVREVMSLDPAIEPDLTDARAGMCVELPCYCRIK